MRIRLLVGPWLRFFAGICPTRSLVRALFPFKFAWLLFIALTGLGGFTSVFSLLRFGALGLSWVAGLAGTGTAAPETYAEALSALAADAVIPGPLGARLAQAVRLRNILVHGYLDIDHGRLFDELDWIESTEEFAAAIEHWLEQNVDH